MLVFCPGRGLKGSWENCPPVSESRTSLDVLLGLDQCVLIFLQIEELQVVRGRLCCSGFCCEVQPIPPERTGPELQRPAGLWTEAALWFPGESRLRTGDSEVRNHVGVHMDHMETSWHLTNVTQKTQ